ncbi:MAG: hypothetical protein AAFP84_08550, partial [Actinomycetota bacterium]
MRLELTVRGAVLDGNGAGLGVDVGVRGGAERLRRPGVEVFVVDLSVARVEVWGLGGVGVAAPPVVSEL